MREVYGDNPTSKAILYAALFLIGLLGYAYFFINEDAVLPSLKMPTFSLMFSVILITVPLFIFIKFLVNAYNLAERFEHMAFSTFFFSLFFRFAHTLFLIALSFVMLSLAIHFFVDYFY